MKNTKSINKPHNHKTEYVGAAIVSAFVGMLFTGIVALIGTNTRRA